LDGGRGVGGGGGRHGALARVPEVGVGRERRSARRFAFSLDLKV
jgi:hypothetical protein